MAAVVFCHWFYSTRLLECHACAAPKYRGRWLNKATIPQLFMIQPIAGANALIAQLSTPDSYRVWSALGFRLLDDFGFAILDVETGYDGRSEQGVQVDRVNRWLIGPRSARARAFANAHSTERTSTQSTKPGPERGSGEQTST
ncbi:MAG: hypothetical protein GY906_23015 [bacterium]|nr:hypothetical protein [bacterium]